MFKRTKKKGKVYVGLSGGVDSAVSAALLKREGFEVVGVFIRIALSGYPCPAAEDRIEAMRVAAHLKIPFLEIDLSKAYEERVFAFSVEEFKKGRTPNPDAMCNREIKFGLFYEFARAHGADFVATGHYARVASQNNSLRVHKFSAKNLLSPRAVALRSPSKSNSASLFVSSDDTKDQSYFLWAVPEEHLKHTLFPVGGMHKTEVRNLARKFKLPNNARPDSQGLCFLGPISIEDMLVRETHPTPGEVLSEDDTVLGTHKGVQLYTLGQRHGFELAVSGNHAEPHFVVAKDIERNTITVSTNRFPRTVQKTELTLVQENWIGEVLPGNYMARFRYRQKLIPATFSIEGGKTKIVLAEPHYVPEGQSLVLYEREEACLPAGRCVGGGIINTATLI
ncbi:MAG: tRNA 2-thiouridine(34) synthase MnmA [Patescibacteria group bacterium]